jgi:hypothetical protein
MTTTTRGMLIQSCKTCGARTWMMGEAGPECEACAPVALEGSEKQVAWATKIRAAFLAECPTDENGIMAAIARGFEDGPEAMAFAGVTALDLRARAAAGASASDWIDTKWRWDVRICTVLEMLVVAKRTGTVKSLSRYAPVLCL